MGMLLPPEVVRTLDALGDGVMVVDHTSEVRFMNRALVAQFGDQTGKPCYQLLGRDVPCSPCALDHILKDAEGSFRYITHAPNDRWYELTASPFEVSDGRVLVLETLCDVTEAQGAKEASFRLNQELDSLLAASAATVSSLEVGRVVQQIVEHALKVIPSAEVGLLFEYDEDSQVLVPTAVAGPVGEDFLRMSLRPGEGVSGKVFQDRSPAIYSPIDIEIALDGLTEENYRLFSRSFRGSGRPQSAISAPLLVGEQVLGCITLDSFAAEGSFSEAELRLLQSFANQAAMALQNARLYESAAQRNEELAVRNKELSGLNTLATGILSSIELQDVISTALHSILAATKGEGGLVLLLDDKGTLRVAAEQGLSQGNLRETLDWPGSLFQAGQALAELRPIIYHDLDSDAVVFLAPLVQEGWRSAAVIPLMTKDHAFGVMGLLSRELNGFSEDDARFLMTAASQVALAVDNAKLYEETKNRALTDGLTGLYNHTHFFERVREAISRNARYHEPFSTVLMDIDGLKSFNDTHGHLAGDQVLRTVADAMRQGKRDLDVAARYGGDEFALLLPRTTPEQARDVVDRIRKKAITLVVLRKLTTRAEFGISAGISHIKDQPISGNELIHRADAALYRAKSLGGDKTVIHDDSSAQPAQISSLRSP